MAYQLGDKPALRMDAVAAGEQSLEFGSWPGKGFLKKLKQSISCPGGVCKPDRKVRKAMRKLAKKRAAYTH
jgi:hypothetical protein